VSDEHIREAAEAMVASGLADHGWAYINIDDYWQVKPSEEEDASLQGPERDAGGRVLPNPRFPDMKALADHVHGLGLKIGLYSSPGPLTCGGCVGSFDHESLDAQSYAEWGFDYLKHDWCSYRPDLEARRERAAPVRGDFDGLDASRVRLMVPYAVMRAALDAQPRDIVYSLCQYGMGEVSEWGGRVGGNCWRTTGDIVDTWQSMSQIGFGQAGLEEFAEPGRWNDPDMLVVGMVGWGPSLHPTRLTPNEQYTHISLWCLLSAPLLIGCDLTQLDEFTLGLLTNDEVLDVNQDPLGRQAARVKRDGFREVWAKPMADGSLAVGFFNRGPFETEVSVALELLGVTGKPALRDLWRQRDLGEASGTLSYEIPRHGCMLVKVGP
jgi:alpha-galactosidase